MVNKFIIKSGKMKDFIEESNKNKITDEFLEECRKHLYYSIKKTKRLISLSSFSSLSHNNKIKEV